MKKIAKNLSLLAAIGIASTLIASPASASVRTPGINHHQSRQQRRIANGIASGSLTANEAIRLKIQQRRIQREKLAAKSDGFVSRNERRQIRRDQRNASRHIYRLKHNRWGR